MWNFVEMIPITMILGPCFCSLRKRWIKLSTIAILMFFFFVFLWFKWQYYLVGKKMKKRVKLASSTLTTPSWVTILFLVCNSFSILITKKENKIFRMHTVTISKIVELSNVEKERMATFIVLSCVVIPTHGPNTKVLTQV